MLTAVLVVGLKQAGGSSDDAAPRAARFDLSAARKRLAGSPAPLAALHAQSAQLLDGGVPAFERRLAALKGTPVVVNKWASWCSPCRAEFPVFQRVATDRGREIAFLGVNAGDSTGPARQFLAQYPVPFPSYVDPDEKIARAIFSSGSTYEGKGTGYCARKTAFIHQGGYSSERQLVADIDRYLVA